MKINTQDAHWQKLVNCYNLSPDQLNKFKSYLSLLMAWNKKFNLTTINDESEIINYHFDDSLALVKFIDLSKIKAVADIGSGGGFPGLPLKIFAPHLQLILIEVQGKKVEFLKAVVQELGLENVLVEQVDWRTFLRHSDFRIDLFCARASLALPELLRVFKPSSHYQNSTLVYWASTKWWTDFKNQSYAPMRLDYAVGDRNLTLAVFEIPPKSKE